MKMTGADILTSILADAGISVVSGIPGHTVKTASSFPRTQ